MPQLVKTGVCTISESRVVGAMGIFRQLTHTPDRLSLAMKIVSHRQNRGLNSLEQPLSWLRRNFEIKSVATSRSCPKIETVQRALPSALQAR